MVKSIFTIEQANFIKDNAMKMTNKEISEYLNIPIKQIKGRIDSQKLREGTRPPKYTESDIKLIIELYNKVDTCVIAKKLNMTTKQINDKAYNLGLLRDISRHTYNTDYFKTINSEHKAYWLGFMYADGYICQTFNKNTGNLKSSEAGITLKRADENHLKKFIKDINGTQSVRYKDVKLNGNTYHAARISIIGRKFSENLINKGCMPRKSLSIKFPNKEILPDNLVKDFIRGYLDGDGCLHVKNEDYRYIVNLVGTYSFLDSVREILNKELGLTKVVISQKGNAFQISYSGRNNFNKITSYLYNGATIYLNRKYEIYQKYKIA